MSTDLESGTPGHQPIDQRSRSRSRVRLYKAALRGDWKTAKTIIKNENFLADTIILLQGSYTALHVAAGAKHVHFVKEYLREMENLSYYQRIKRMCFMCLPLCIRPSHETPNSVKQILRQGDANGNNPFCTAVAAGSVEIAKLMIGMDEGLINVRGARSHTPLYFAAQFGHVNMTNYLYDQSPTDSEDDLLAVFFTSIKSGLFGFALKLLNAHPNFALSRDPDDQRDGKTALHLLAQKPSTFISGNLSHTLLKDLLNILELENLRTIKLLIRSPTHVLFDAVESGNAKLVVDFIDTFPDLIWETDAQNRTVIHAAVSRRDASIYNLIHEIGLIKNVIVTFRDTQRNSILHLAAQLAPTSQLNQLRGAAFQMQRELLWFEEVKKIMHPADIESRNSPQQGITTEQQGTTTQQQGTTLQEQGNTTQRRGNTIERRDNTTQQRGKTPQELFTSEHEELLKEGRKWMNGTARSCTIVSTLIAGALFAAGITVALGGNRYTGNQSNQTIVDHHLKHAAYQIFIISDAMAFLLALAATLTFLAILTSRYAERDFLRSLPFKLRMGLALLFLSIIGMMVAFATVFFIAYGRKYFLPALVTVFAIFPVVLYVYLQFSLLKDIFCPTSPF